MFKRAVEPGGTASTVRQTIAKMTPIPKQRREAKHDARHRQLPALALALLMSLAGARGFAAAPPAPSAQEEMRAAKLLETALFARQAGAEDWRKLDVIYRELGVKYPRDAAVRNGQAEFFWSIGERARAVETWEAALEIEPKNAVVLDHLGGSYLAAGEVKKSAGYYARAVECAPQNATYRFTLANVTFLFRHELLDATQPDEAAVLGRALSHFAEASRLDPLNQEYARAYAETFYSLPKPDWNAGLAAWQRFSEITPQKDFAQTNLARVHLKLGQKDAARACLDKVQSLDFQRLKARLSERIETE